MGLSSEYIKEIKRETTYSPTWLPNRKISLGDVGCIKNYQYVHLTTLSEIGVDFKEKNSNVQAEFQYCSANAVSINISANGKTPTSIGNQVEAGISIKFSRENAILFRLSKCKSSIISDHFTLGEQIENLYSENKWKREMVVITEVVTAASSTILISKGKNSEVELQATGKISSSFIDLATIDGHFKILNEKNIAVNIVASKGLTPLFKASGIKRGILRGSEFEQKKYQETKNSRNSKQNIISFEDLDYEDFDPSDAESNT